MFGFLERFKVGPWRCVDCGNRQMFIERRDNARRDINERVNQGSDNSAPVGNFIRTKDALINSVVDSARFSEKYRAGVVQKLLNRKITLSRVCEDLSISEFEIQRWIRSWVDSELNRQNAVYADFQKVISRFSQMDDCQNDQADSREVEPRSGKIIESEVLRRNK